MSFIGRLTSPTCSEQEANHYRGSGWFLNIERPTWEDVVAAVVRLDGGDHNDVVQLAPNDISLGWLLIYGGGNEFAVVRHNTRSLFLENVTRQTSELSYPTMSLSLPERFTHDLATALQVARYFYDHGEVEANQSWVWDADIEDLSHE